MKLVEIYTDGSCHGNPGPGGWAAVLRFQTNESWHEKNLFGGDKHTTNNKMEMMAAIKALEALNEPCMVKLFTDSSYLRDGFVKGWVASWKKKNWQRKNGALLNAPYWKKLDELNSFHSITWIKVKAHSGNHYNELCDEIANRTAEEFANKKDAKKK